jgi:hypothetical protein
MASESSVEKHLSVEGHDIRFRVINVSGCEQINMVCATDLCTAGGKRWGKFMELKSTKLYIPLLAVRLGVDQKDLVHIISGVSSWIHPRIVMPLAIWISTEFAVSMSGWLDEWRLASAANQVRWQRELKHIKSDPKQD